MSFCSVLSAAVIGLRVEFIHVEADVSNGLPVFHMVGYLSSEVKEAAERILQIVGGKSTTGFILGPGCALGGDTPKENIQALIDSVKFR